MTTSIAPVAKASLPAPAFRPFAQEIGRQIAPTIADAIDAIDAANDQELAAARLSSQDVELLGTARRLSEEALDALVELAALTEPVDAATAETAYRQAIANDPCHVGAFAQLTALLSRQGRHDDALEVIDQAVGWCGDVGALHHHAGVALEAAGRLTDALGAYDRALDRDPTLAESHYRLGLLCERLGDPRASARHFRAYHRLTSAHAANERLN